MKKFSDLLSIEYILLTIIIIAAFTLRLYRISNPLADWHSWRQADTSAVTRKFIADGIDLLYPRYDDLSSIPSGLDNPHGWRFVEFPIINALTAYLYLTFPVLNIEIWGRLTSIIFSLLAIIFLHKIVGFFQNKRVALLSAFIYAFLPYNIYYHRTILPEIPQLFFSLASIYYFLCWIKEEKTRQLLISAGLGAIGMLLKPFTIFLLIPVSYLLFKKFSIPIFRNKLFYIYLVLFFLPFVLWRIWSSQFPEGIPAYSWLLNGSGIRFRPAFFRWIFAERFGKLIFGYWALAPFILGILRKPNKKTGWYFHLWLFSMLLYIFVFATGNVTHDYYQIIVIPILAVFTALGVDLLLELPKPYFNQKISYLVALITLGFGMAFAWYNIRDFFNINHPEIVVAGQAANVILPKEAKVIAPYSGDTAFLYQINRSGWPISGDIQDRIKKGATDYVSVSYDDETKMLIEKCKPALRLDIFTIVSLRDCSL